MWSVFVVGWRGEGGCLCFVVFSVRVFLVVLCG